MKLWELILCLSLLILVTLFMALALPGAKADVALMLNDFEKAKLIQFIARGLADHPEDVVAGVYLFNKINTAPVVTEHKDPPSAPAESPKNEEPKP